MTELTIGSRFAVTKIREVRDSRGQLLARYHPTHPETAETLDYTVTPRNAGIVRQLIADGVASIVEGVANIVDGGTHAADIDVAAPPARLSGTIDTGNSGDSDK